MVNYQNSKIYKLIYKLDSNIFYIGSTTQKLCKRYSCHSSKFKTQDSAVYKIIKEKYQHIKFFKMILIEEYPCQNKEQLLKKEQEYIDKLNPILNRQRAYNSLEYQRTYWRNNSSKYYYNNIDKVREYNKIYIIKNKKQIDEKNKEYRLKNEEKLKENNRIYRLNNKEYYTQYNKEYRLNKENKIKISNKMKEYYKKNKERMNKKITCKCGLILNKSSMYNHIKTKKHIQLMNQKE